MSGMGPIKKNTQIWEAMHSTPDEYVSIIPDGDLKGKSNVKPTFVWRRLTEVFGPEGVGFAVREVESIIEDHVEAKQTIYHVRVSLKYRGPDGEWSEPIERWGQSILVRTTNNGYVRPNVYVRQMAHTNGLKQCANALGVMADIYLNEAYDDPTPDSTASGSHESKPEPKPKPEEKDKPADTPWAKLWAVWLVKAEELGLDPKGSQTFMSNAVKKGGVTELGNQIELAIEIVKGLEAPEFDSDDKQPPLPPESEAPDKILRYLHGSIKAQLKGIESDPDVLHQYLIDALPDESKGDLATITTMAAAAALVRKAVAKHKE